MLIVDDAMRYCCARGITRKEPIYSANRFSRVFPEISSAAVTTDHFAEYRSKCLADGLSPTTIESSISDLQSVIEYVTKQRVSAGQRLRRRPPTPEPVPIQSIDACWPHASTWLRQWIAIVYWTGMRLADSIDFIASADLSTSASIHREADKTRKRHCWPVPAWLSVLLDSLEVRFHAATDYAAKRTRKAIAACCRVAGVPVWTPQHLRQRSVTEWTRADGIAGNLVHGRGLGVMDHYVDPLAVLESHQHKVRLPECFGAHDLADSEASMVLQFRQLDPEARQLVRLTIERLA